MVQNGCFDRDAVEDCPVHVDSAMQQLAPHPLSLSSADHSADAMDKFISLIERGDCTVHCIRSTRLPFPSALTSPLRWNPRASKQGWHAPPSTDGKHSQHLQQRVVSPVYRLQRAREPGAPLKFKSFLSAGMLHVYLLRFPEFAAESQFQTHFTSFIFRRSYCCQRSQQGGQQRATARTPQR